MRRGLTLADLRLAGTWPEDREELISVVRKGAKSGEMVWRREEGMGSRGQEVARFDLMSLSTSSGERGENEEKPGTGGREVRLVARVLRSAAGG